MTPAGDRLARIGATVIRGLSELGQGTALVAECLHWIVRGRGQGQPVRVTMVLEQMVQIGLQGLPIIAILSATIGAMLAIQGIYTLRAFGAEGQVVFGIALSMVREFSPLITAILVAGRSGSALAARLGSMTIHQEIDALRVMAIDPVRFLVAPVLAAMVIILPCLTFFSDLVGLLAAGLYVRLELGLGLMAFADQISQFLKPGDLLHGLGKSLLFAILITAVGVVNGTAIRGGAEGVGRVTTRAVVHAIAAIVITDMLFAFVVTR